MSLWYLILNTDDGHSSHDYWGVANIEICHLNERCDRRVMVPRHIEKLVETSILQYLYGFVEPSILQYLYGAFNTSPHIVKLTPHYGS